MLSLEIREKKIQKKFGGTSDCIQLLCGKFEFLPNSCKLTNSQKKTISVEILKIRNLEIFSAIGTFEQFVLQAKLINECCAFENILKKKIVENRKNYVQLHLVSEAKINISVVFSVREQ